MIYLIYLPDVCTNGKCGIYQPFIYINSQLTIQCDRALEGGLVHRLLETMVEGRCVRYE